MQRNAMQQPDSPQSHDLRGFCFIYSPFPVSSNGFKKHPGAKKMWVQAWEQTLKLRFDKCTHQRIIRQIVASRAH
jgi:hypothetical protein